MKHFKFIKESIIVVTLLSLGIILGTSCAGGNSSAGEEPEIPNVDPKPSPTTRADSVTIKVGVDYSVTESPLTRVSGNDLYGVSIYNKQGTYYAAGLFDDPSLVSFRLVKGNTYTIVVILYENGANDVPKRSDGLYGYPFYDPYTIPYVINQPIYDNDGQIKNPMNNMLFYMKGTSTYVNDLTEYVSNNRYIGLQSILADKDQIISIDAKKGTMGITLNIVNSLEGTFYFNYMGREIASREVKESEKSTVSIEAPISESIDYSIPEFIGNPRQPFELYFSSKSEGIKTLLISTDLNAKMGVNYNFNFEMLGYAGGNITVNKIDDKTDEEAQWDN
jgi:hypothetical protein